MSPAINLGKSAGFLALTATLTTGETVYFIDLIILATGEVVIVPCFKIASSTPTKEQVLPQGISTTSSVFFPIITTTLCTVLILRSLCFPGTY